MITLKLNGKTYELEVGKEFVIDDLDLYGNLLTILTADYEVLASRVKDSTFVVTGINFLSATPDEPVEDVIEEEAEKFDFTKLKKAELVKIAKDMGIFVSAKTTKKELLELINEQ